MVRLERLLKILIPWGDIDRPDKLLNSFKAYAGWTAIKIFPQQIGMPARPNGRSGGPNTNLRQAEGGHKSKRQTDGDEKF